MGSLFIERIAADLYTLCYKDKDGKSRAYQENRMPVSFVTEKAAQERLDAIVNERMQADSAIAFSLEEAENFIKKQEWIFASTCENSNPHEYIVKKNLRPTMQKRFERFVATIKANPSLVVINGYTYKSFILDDYYYWIKEPYDNMAAYLICRARREYLILLDGVYYYNEQKVQEVIKRREQWKKDLKEEINRRSSMSVTRSHLPRKYIDAIESDVGEYINQDKDKYKPVPREIFHRADKDTHRIFFGDLIWSKGFNLQEPLQAVIGNDTNQSPVFCDVAKMPNLLVAGGEMINFIDAMLLSVLCKASPEQVRFLLIDTGVLYLSRYEGIPHLIAPVTCNPSIALDALKWAQSEMNRRYELFANKGVKDISSYNQLIEYDDKPLPRLLIVIKDIVDLMLYKGNEVLHVIKTLLNDWHPGMHLVLATTRPDSKLLPEDFVNLIAGKVFFGSSSGAGTPILGIKDKENSLGRGTMLYFPLAASIPIAGQGVAVTDDDVLGAVDYLKKYGTNYDSAVVKMIIGDRDVKLMLKATEYNWSLLGPEDWSEVEWEIYYDRTYRTKVSFVPKYDRETKKSIDTSPIEKSGTMDEITFVALKSLINTKVWRDPNIEVHAYDGEVWKIDYYSTEGNIINSSGDTGYIYGEKLLIDIVNLLAKLQRVYYAPAYVSIEKKNVE